MKNPDYIFKIKRNDKTFEELTLIILGGNYSYRMKTSGPKPLYHIENEKRTIDHIIQSVETTFPKCEKIVTVGFEAQKVISYIKNVRFIENQLFESTNTAEEARLALNATLNKQVLLVNSDITFESCILSKLNLNKSTIWSQENPDNNIVSVNVINDKIEFFTFDNPIKWCNIVYLTGKELELTKRICANYPYSKHFLFEILNHVIMGGGNIHNIDTTGTSFKKFYSIAKLKQNENSDS